LDPENKYCVSTRIRVARNLEGFPLVTHINKAQRKEVEGHAKKAFESFDAELKGTYYSLESMNEKDKKSLIEDHFLFKEGDRFLKAAGITRDWPEGRGIFHNE
jgi:protein-arginine kinase